MWDFPPNSFPKGNWLKSESLSQAASTQSKWSGKGEKSPLSVNTWSILPKPRAIIDFSCLFFLKSLNLSSLGQKAFILTEELRRGEVLFAEDREKD